MNEILIVTSKLGDMCMFRSNEVKKGDRIYANLPKPQPAQHIPEFSRIAAQKLARLQADGYTVNGVHIQRTEDGRHKHGAVTAQGMVLWWGGLLDAAPQPEQPSMSKMLDVAIALAGRLHEILVDDTARIEKAAEQQPQLATKEPTFEEWTSDYVRDNLHKLNALQPAQTVEPVAKITGIDEYGPMLGWHRHWANFPVGTSLYTSPQPQRQPLTDEQWFKFWEECDAIPGDSIFPEFLQIARAIEARSTKDSA